MEWEERIEISQEPDIARAVEVAMRLAREIGFGGTQTYMIGTSVAELARNILMHAGTGEVRVRQIEGERRGIQVVAEDEGPGIRDIEEVMSEGYVSEKGLGLGLKGVRRMMDEFFIDPSRKVGAKVVVRKWL